MQISTDAMSSSSSFADSDSTCSMLTPSLEFPDRISFRKIDLSKPGPSSTKGLRCRGFAANLATMIENVQPAVNEILYSSVEVSEDRQVQLRMFSETLDKCKKLTDKALKCNRWNMVRQLYHVKKMEDLEKKISKFVQTLPLHILADVHHRRVDVEVRLDRIDRACDSLNEKIDSMKIRGSESMREALKTAETTMEMVTDGDLGNLGVGLELGKRKVKDMLFEGYTTDEACSFTTNEGDSSRIVSNTWPIYASGGSIITSWQKGQLLGRGSFGSVYEGISEDGDFLAVNEGSLLDQESHAQECIQQLEAEIALLSQLQGQNIMSSSSSSVDSDSTCSFITPSLEFPDRISFRKMDLSEAGPSGTKALRCRGIAANLVTMIENVHPAINEILYSGVEVSEHRQVQLRMFSETLDKCKKLTDKVLKCPRWNMVRQLYHVKKMEDLEKKISTFIDGLSLHVLADFHRLRADTEVRLDRIDRHLDSLNEKLGSMKIRGSESMREVLKTAETTMEMVTDGDLGNLGVGLELRKRKVKDMLFESNDEARLIGISGMSGSGKTTLAREIESDQEVRGHFGNRVLFLIVSQSPNVEELRSHIWGFLTGYDASFGATSGDQTRKLVILDDVWTRESLDQLLFDNIPGTTTLVVSRSKLAGPRTTYDVELLNENEATSLFCLSAFDQKSIPLGFSKSLVKQVVGECKGLPLSLKVVGASLKNQPEKYWEGAVMRLSRGEPADQTHESRVFAQIEATLENLDPKTRECFLVLGAFPEDKKIPLDVLINVLVELHDLEDATAFAVIVDLANRNLLTLVKDPRFGDMYTSYYDIFVTQHDVLRDVALRLSNCGKVNNRERLLMPKRESLPREWERSNDEPYKARIVSIHTGEMTEMDWFDMELPKAEVLILNFSSEKYVLPPFIAKMGRLRALVIINNGMSPARLHDFSIFTNLAKLRSLWLERVHVPELSSSTVPLKNLHKLSLILCKIDNSFDQTEVDIAQIFPNLSDLTIDHCDDLVELPSTICGITTLNSISVTNCPRIKELPKNLSKLKALQLLRLYACPELKSLPVEICELPRLKYVDISQCVSLSSLPEEIGKVKTLEKIDMRDCSLSSIPSSAVSLNSLRHVICDREALWMWENVERAVPGLRVEAVEKYFSLDWLDE